ncbi:MAG: hypothetical protein K6E92_02175 [Lachnospiraceae bacterium]|nr:hypothetical protein [Lachnospiraceae bacterium]
MGVGRISPISGYGSVSYIQPMQYRVDNTSAPSDAYAESVKRTGGRDAVSASRPVQYANAQATGSMAASPKQSEEAQKTEAAFNRIASSYDQAVTGYGRGGQGSSYDVIGSQLNLFA